MMPKLEDMFLWHVKISTVICKFTDKNIGMIMHVRATHGRAVALGLHPVSKIATLVNGIFEF